ncbi:MAG: M20 family metallopeptidase [Pirellulaceae bacterium]
MDEFRSPESVTDLLCQLIAIPSVNPMGRDLTGPEYYEGRLSDWLVKFFQSFGAEYERIETAPGRANVIARYDAADAPLTLLLDAHQDTVPVDGMTIPPFEPRVAEGRIAGRGASDVKGGLAAMLYAFRRLVVERPAGAASVVMSCTCDEESTSLGITDLVRYWQEPDGRSRLVATPPDGAVIAEPTGLDVVVAHRGATRFRIRTAGRACHSSDPSQGVSAIYRMARVVTCLEEYADVLTRTVPPHPRCGGATLSVGRIEGGASVNIVPDDCAIEVDRRVIPGEDRQAVLPPIRQFLAERLDFDVQFETPWLEGPALADDDNHWLAEALLERVTDVAGPHQAVGVPYGTHASRTAAAGVPSVVFGPGSIAQAHTKDEYLEVDQLEAAAEVYYRFCAWPPGRQSRP